MFSRLLSISILMVLILLSLGWLFNYDNYIALEIMAPRDGIDTVPVYAQYIVTQTIVLHEETEVISVVIPIQLGEKDAPMSISLKGNSFDKKWYLNEELDEWQEGVIDVEFVLDDPTFLKGLLEVYFEAPDILDSEAFMANGVLKETYDDGYVDGNYRVAENSKKGDIGLTVVARQRRIASFISDVKNNYIYGIQTIGVYLMVVLIFTFLPLTISVRVRNN